MTLRRIGIAVLATLALALAPISAEAGTTTIAVTPGSGSTIYQVGTNAAGNYFGYFGICDGAACANLASVTAAGTPGTIGLAIQGMSGAVAVPVSASSWPLPLNAAQETGGNLATLAGAVSAGVVQANTKQVNGVATLAGAGATGTGSQRVTAAQDTTTIAGSAPGVAGTPSANVVSIQGVAGGTAQPVSVAAAVSVTPKTAAFVFTGCSVTTSSAQCLAGATAVNHIQVQNTSATAVIACNFGGTAILNSSGSFMLASLQSAAWGPTTAGVPSAALNCIGSISATLYIEYN